MTGPESTDITRAFRDCVGAFATGVTVVTVASDEGNAGMTVNSFTSVSLDPMLILVSMAHGSRTLEAVKQDARFTVSVLGCEQDEVAMAFARSNVPFPEEHVTEEPGGYLPVKDALAVLYCEVDKTVEAGDHDLVIGKVLHFDGGCGEPLMFWRGQFGELAPEVVASVEDQRQAG